MTARYLSNLAAALTPEGIIPAAKGGTGTTTGGGGGGPKISGVTVTDSSYNVLDDTAVALAGGYIKITGSGFETGCQVLVNTTAATSVTFISATEVRAQVPATTAGTYIIYVVNTDGGTAIRVNGITFSTTPTWTTESPLAGLVNSDISVQLAATGATTFSVAGGSSLPSGVSLNSAGLLTGTVTGISGSTTYNFTVNATDSELQDSPKTFAFNISLGDPYFKYTTLLLSANGTNGAQNNTFVDSSTNNFAITRNGNTTQGTFTPYGANWSNYFDGSGDYLTAPSNAAFNFGTGDFTVECWVYVISFTGSTNVIISTYQDGSNGWTIGITSNVFYGAAAGDTAEVRSSVTPPVNIWTHLALTRSSTTLSLFINGVVAATQSNSTNMSTTSAVTIGTNVGGGALNFTGYISNVRVVKGTAVYTSAFTPPTAPLTAIANTSLLTCQSNRLIDNSTNNFTITKNGDVSVQRFSPFSPGSAYSTSVIGGSGYFDGAGDHLSIPTATPLVLSGSSWTIECWVYPTFALSTSPYQVVICKRVGASAASYDLYFNLNSGYLSFYNGTGYNSSALPIINAWNHIAAVYDGTNINLYMNGARVLQTATTNPDNGGNLYIGADENGTSNFFTGYISNVRILKGTVLYNGTTYTVPTAPLTAITNTSLLLSYTNAGIIDNTMQNNLETVDNAQISTAQTKFGGSSMSFDGTGDYCFLPKTSSFLFSSGDFTIELWTYISDTTTRKYILGPGTDTASHYKGFGLEIWGQQLCMWASSNGTSWNMLDCDTSSNRGSTLMAANTWYNITVSRSNGTFRSFVNGVVEKTFAVAGTIYSDPTVPYNIGRSGYSPGNYFYFNGYMDDLRVTKGVARYTNTFTPSQTLLVTQ